MQRCFSLLMVANREAKQRAGEEMAEPLSNHGASYRSVPESYKLPVHKRPAAAGTQTEAAAASIPVVDLGNGDMVEQVMDAGRHFGFFQVINHGVAGEVMAEMMTAAEEFFRLPAAEKMSYYSTDGKKLPRFHTSVGNDQEKVLYWRDCLKLGCYPFQQFRPQWPDKPPRLAAALEAYTEAVRAVALRLLRLTAAGLGLDEGRFEQANLTAGPVLMNVNHYVPCPDPSLTLGLAPHCDPNLVTILMANGAGGLQARPHHGGGWVDVDPLPGAFVVNFGHQMEAVTNGRVRSGEHRVVTNASAARTSVATFVMPEMGCTVAPVPELLSEGEPPMCRPYTYEEFVAVYTSEMGDRDAVLAHFQKMNR